MTPSPVVREALSAQGHSSSGLCEKCWALAKTMFEDGGYESLIDAYYAAMREAEDRVLSRELESSDG